MILMMTGNWQPSPAHVERLERLVGGRYVHVAAAEEDAVHAAAGARYIIGHRYLRQVLPHAPLLEWVQTSAAGVDQLPLQELVARGVALTRNPLNSEAIALHALALMLALVRRLPEALDAQRDGCWAAPFAMGALPRRVCLLGLGSVGRALAPRLRGLGVQVIGCARRGSAEQRAVCDVFFPADAWREAVSGCDGLILALPLTSETEGMIDARVLEALAPGALLINVARAGLMRLDEVLEALRSGRLAGVAIDVLEPRPEPTHPIWRTSGLIITPKVAAYHPTMQQDFEAFVERQVAARLAGHPLEARVALESGA